jgi:excisionase family DNA binding protein
MVLADAVGGYLMSLPALYTPEEAAAKLKVTRRAVYQWLSEGRLKGLRAGLRWRITEDSLMEFMNSPATGSTEKPESATRDKL